MKFKYLLVYVTPLVILISLVSSGWITYLAVIVLFIFIPILELILSGSEQNMNEFAEGIAKENKFYDCVIYSMVPIQLIFTCLFLENISKVSLDTFEKIGMILAFGLSCGIFGINVAHELGHRNTRYEQWMAKLLLLTSQYMHFFIEHNKGHHKHVSTDLDPASSKYGESLYSFYYRSIKDSWFSAWKIEGERLNRLKFNFWSLKNEMLQFQLLQFVAMLLIYWLYNLETLWYYLSSALIGILLLEAVNYIQHYGLRRKRKGDGSYERTLPIHSWNSNKPLGRILLFELTRHSDHHFMTNRPYQILRHHDESLQMPTGYPGMMILAFIPTLWFKIVHKTIDKFKIETGDLLA